MQTDRIPTRVVRAAGDASCVRLAVEHLGRGDVVALPTETVYGLAADATRPEAVAKVFAAKDRPSFDPLIVHLPGLDWIDRVASVAREERALVEKLAAAFWPGPFTLVLPKTALIPGIVTSGKDSVAVRMSRHPVFHAVIEAFGRPLAAPSANRFGRISPTRADHVLAELDGRIPLIVDGGPTECGVESTIVRPEPDGALTILRPGPVTAAEMASFGPVAEAWRTVPERPDAPGQFESHYAPATPLVLAGEFDSARLAGRRCGFLAWDGWSETGRYAHVEVLSPSGDAVEAACRLFDVLRRLDNFGLDLIVAELAPESGLGAAINDRLRRAAAKRSPPQDA